MINGGDNAGVEGLADYDASGNPIHFKMTIVSEIYSEGWIEYDSYGNKIYSKLIEKKSDDEPYEITEIWSEYTYWSNGKIKTMKEFSAVE